MEFPVSENQDRTPIESLPLDIQRYIGELRDEAAKHRTAKNSEAARASELEAKYTEAGGLLKAANDKLSEFESFTDQHEKLLSEHEQLRGEFTKTTIAAKHGLLDHVDRLKGATEEELEADAVKLAESFGAKPPPTIPVDNAAGKPPTPLTDADELTKSFRSALGL